jgi:hypothetical protein
MLAAAGGKEFLKTVRRELVADEIESWRSEFVEKIGVSTWLMPVQAWTRKAGKSLSPLPSHLGAKRCTAGKHGRRGDGALRGCGRIDHQDDLRDHQKRALAPAL